MRAKQRTLAVLCMGVLTLSIQFGASQALAQGPQPLPVAKGVYRLPYADGTSVGFSNDHTSHPTTLNRIDMNGQGGGPYTAVAAAAGIIRILVENNDTTCPNACGPVNDCDNDGTTTVAENAQAQNTACPSGFGIATWCCERHVEANGGSCPGSGTCQNGPNNFVWIQHANGEWTKYTHLQRGSIGSGTDNNGNPGAGRFVGESVNAGDPLGLQGDVGIATGPHVHFEVGVPDFVPGGTVNDWFTAGGTLVNDGILDDVDGDGSDDVNRQNRIPAFCQVGFANAGDVNTAGPCDDLCTTDTSELLVTIPAGSIFYRQVTDTMGNPAGDFVASTNSGVSIRAGTRITLSPGFHAEMDSFFSASIGSCDSPGGVGE